MYFFDALNSASAGQQVARSALCTASRSSYFDVTSHYLEAPIHMKSGCGGAHVNGQNTH